MSDVCRAEVVGSLLRPGYLKAARARWMAPDGGMSTAEFKRIEDRAVDEAIALQEGTGLDVLTDGEMRRVGFQDPVTASADGFSPIPGVRMHWEAHEEGVAPLEFNYPMCVTGKLTRTRFLTLEDFSYARGQTRTPLKVTLPGPLSVISAWTQESSTEAYSDPFDLFSDVADMVKTEAEELARLGCEYIQIDCPEWTALCDPDQSAALAARGIAPDRLVSEGVELCNRIAAIPGVKFGMHLCRGSLPTHFYSSGGYDAIAEDVLARATNFDVFMLEYDDERSGSFEPLAKMPTEKVIALGLVSTKKTEVETVDDITGRIEEAGKYFPLENLAVSSQCGFGSGFSFDSPADWQAAKLQLVADTADRVWG